MNNVERFKALTTEMADTYERKNADYGDSYGESLNEFGIIAGVVRMGDKFNRLKSLSKHQRRRVKDESIRDTLLDLANYAVMSVLWLDAKEADKRVSDEGVSCDECSNSYNVIRNGISRVSCLKKNIVEMNHLQAKVKRECEDFRK